MGAISNLGLMVKMVSENLTAARLSAWVERLVRIFPVVLRVDRADEKPRLSTGIHLSSRFVAVRTISEQMLFGDYSIVVVRCARTNFRDINLKVAELDDSSNFEC